LSTNLEAFFGYTDFRLNDKEAKKMSIDEADIKFSEALFSLRSIDDRGLFLISEGFIHLCKAIKQIDARLADLDEKIEHLSQQVRPK